MDTNNDIFEEYNKRIEKLRAEKNKIEKLKQDEEAKQKDLVEMTRIMESDMQEMLSSFDSEKPKDSKKLQKYIHNEMENKSRKVEFDIENISVDKIYNDFNTHQAQYESDGTKPKSLDIKLEFAHVGTNLNFFTVIETELIKSLPTLMGATGTGIPIQRQHDTENLTDTAGWVLSYGFNEENKSAHAIARITEPITIEGFLRDEIRYCSLAAYVTPICSICGENLNDWEKCEHYPGESYEIDGEMVICTVLAYDMIYQHIGLTNFPADTLATVKILATASKQLNKIIKNKKLSSKKNGDHMVNTDESEINKEEILDVELDNDTTDTVIDEVEIDTELIEDTEVKEDTEVIEEIQETEEDSETETTETEDLDVEESKSKIAELETENAKLKAELSEKNKVLEKIEKTNQEIIISSIIEIESKIKEIDTEKRKTELSEKDKDILKDYLEMISNVETPTESKTITNSEILGKTKNINKLSAKELRDSCGSFKETMETITKNGE